MSDTNTAIATQSATNNNLMQVIKDLPEEKQKEILRAEKALAIASLPQTQSRDLIGKRLNILDALFSTMPVDDKKSDELKQVVVFVIQDAKTGEVHAVTKSSNFFNDAYVYRFEAYRGAVADLPVIADMTFVEDDKWQVAGNSAVILRAYHSVSGDTETKSINKK